MKKILALVLAALLLVAMAAPAFAWDDSGNEANASAAQLAAYNAWKENNPTGNYAQWYYAQNQVGYDPTTDPDSPTYVDPNPGTTPTPVPGTPTQPIARTEDGKTDAEMRNHTITVDGSTAGLNDGPLTGHTFKAYQIFWGNTTKGDQTAGNESSHTGDGSSRNMSVSNWGNGVDGPALIAALGAATVNATDSSKVDVTTPSGTVTVPATLKTRLGSAASAADFASKMAAFDTNGDGDTDDENEGNLSVPETVALAKLFEKYIKPEGAVAMPETPAGSGKYVATGLPDGYYLVLDETDMTDRENDAASANILQVVSDATITMKASVPQGDKSVSVTPPGDKKGVNFADRQTTDKEDANIGDTLYFTLYGTTSTQLNKFDKYEMNFVDNLSKGLTVKPGSVKVYFGEKEIAPADYTITDGAGTALTADTKGPVTMKINFADLKSAKDTEGNSLGLVGTSANTITVRYEAILNDEAVVGQDGNSNDVIVEYSNDPNSDTKGKTTAEEVQVFTTQLDVRKHDADNAELPGAEFVLYRRSGEGATATAQFAVTKTVYKKVENPEGNPSESRYFDDENGTASTDTTVQAGKDYYVIDYYVIESWTAPVANTSTDPNNSYVFDHTADTAVDGQGRKASVFSTGTDGKPATYTNVNIRGLEGDADGETYFLKETKAPAGYNKLQNPAQYTIKAEETKSVRYNECTDDGLLANPKEAGLYEYNGTDYETDKGDATKFTLTNDETPQDGKKYYIYTNHYEMSKLEVVGGNTVTDPTAGIVDANIENTNDLTLPQTGGVGTTIFYIVGALLMFGAAVTLVARRRVGNN